jgi:hypothetical protein
MFEWPFLLDISFVVIVLLLLLLGINSLNYYVESKSIFKQKPS